MTSAEIEQASARGSRWRSARMVARAAAATYLILSLSACSALVPGSNVRGKALVDARRMLERVSALAVENASVLDLAHYSDAVSKGEVWPKPAFETIHEKDTSDLPFWATGVSFGVKIDRSGREPRVVVSYAVQGQGSAGSGFNATIANVLTCVNIAIRFSKDETKEEILGPDWNPVECPADVKEYFGASELVTLTDVLEAGG